MRLHRWLIHSCLVQRVTIERGEAGEDVETWSDWSSFRCRLIEAGQTAADSALGRPVEYDYLLALDPKDVGDLGSGTEIVLTDRVKYVTLETDHVLDGPFRIAELTTSRRKRAELVIAGLERVSESTD